MTVDGSGFTAALGQGKPRFAPPVGQGKSEVHAEDQVSVKDMVHACSMEFQTFKDPGHGCVLFTDERPVAGAIHGVTSGTEATGYRKVPTERREYLRTNPRPTNSAIEFESRFLSFDYRYLT